MVNFKEINYKYLQHNLSVIKSCNKKICAVVKADAYGHGANAIVNSLYPYVDFFAVANADEGVNLRKNFKFIKILILGKISEFITALKNNLSITIDNLNDLKKLEYEAKCLNVIALVHIKINTGMNRIGITSTKQFSNMCKYILNSRHLILEGVFTHAFTADCDASIFFKQLERFKKFIELIPKTLSPIIHIGGSWVITHPLPDFIDMVRVGLWLYGYGQINLKPVMKIFSKVIEINTINSGEYIGYGKMYKAPKKMIIATIGIGYADGFVRALSNNGYVKIKNHKCKILGLVCMDMIMCDISHIANIVNIGDKVIIFDNATKISKLTGLCEYEILTNFRKLR